MIKHLGIACASLALVCSAAVLAQEKGGGDETGPYDLVRGWPQNYCGEGFVIGSTAGIWAESPDRVYIFSWGTFGAFPGGFWGVHQFHTDREGHLYTADVHVGRPQKFRPKKGADPAHIIGTYMRGTS